MGIIYSTATSEMIRFGKRLRYLRTQKKLSLFDLSRLCNIDPSNIGQIERAEYAPTIRAVEKLAKGLDISIVELFGGNL